jgi:hypothetical protein
VPLAEQIIVGRLTEFAAVHYGRGWHEAVNRGGAQNLVAIKVKRTSGRR